MRTRYTLHLFVLRIKLKLTGDGHSTLETLALNNWRAAKQWSRLKFAVNPGRVLTKGEELLLEPIGNHSRGTTFLDGMKLIDDKLTEAMTTLFHQIEGEVYYGRFDILCRDIDGLKKLEDFVIVEFNGVGSEPAHIYQPGFSLLQAYRVLRSHIQIVGKISAAQRSRGVSSMTLREIWRVFRSHQDKIKKNKKPPVSNRRLFKA